MCASLRMQATARKSRWFHTPSCWNHTIHICHICSSFSEKHMRNAHLWDAFSQLVGHDCPPNQGQVRHGSGQYDDWCLVTGKEVLYGCSQHDRIIRVLRSAWHSPVFRYIRKDASSETTGDSFRPLLWQAGVATSGITTAGFGQRMADRVMQEMLWWPEYARVINGKPVMYQDVANFGHFVQMQYDSWASCIQFAMHGHGLFKLEWSLHFRCIQVFVMQNVSGKAGRFQELQFDWIEQHSTSLIVPYGKLYRFGRWTDTCPYCFLYFSIQFESIWSHLRCSKWCAVMSIDIAWLVCNNTGIRVK